MRANKGNIISALDNLITSYTNHSIKHNTDTCPLCLVYYNEETHKCNKCLNQVFSLEPTDRFSCMSRGKKYKRLNIQGFLSNKEELVLADFWREVRDYLIGINYVDIIKLSDEVKTGILNIAKKYK